MDKARKAEARKAEARKAEARKAEWILGLVLPPDRAAATVGDWMEDAADRGMVWFWSSVFRRMAAHVWSDIAGDPAFMIAMALRSVGYTIFLAFVTWLLAIFVLLPVGMVIGWIAHAVPFHGPGDAVLESGSRLFGEIWILALTFQTGRWTAKRAPGREMAACIAACIVPAVFFSVLGFAIMHIWGSELERFVAANQNSAAAPAYGVDDVLIHLSLFAGALWVRRQSLRGAVR